MGDLILTDFKSRTWHKPKTLEQQAQELAKEFNRMAEEGDRGGLCDGHRTERVCSAPD